MALIECPECKKEISDKALQCIHCGYPFTQEDKDKTIISSEITQQIDVAQETTSKPLVWWQRLPFIFCWAFAFKVIGYNLFMVISEANGQITPIEIINKGVRDLAFCIAALIFAIFYLNRLSKSGKKFVFETNTTYLLLLTTIILFFTCTFLSGNEKVLPYEERIKITGDARIGWFTGYERKEGGLTINLYNGSTYTIRDITFSVTIKDTNGNVTWSRKYSFRVEMHPLTTVTFPLSVPDWIKRRINQRWEWNIDQVKAR